MLAKIVYAGSNNTSYQQAQADLSHLAELDVSDKQVRRLCKRIGDERVDERDAAVTAYQALPLVERKSAPAAVVPPPLAVVKVDGGRVQIFERVPEATATPPPTASTATAAPLPTASAATAAPPPTASAAATAAPPPPIAREMTAASPPTAAGEAPATPLPPATPEAMSEPEGSVAAAATSAAVPPPAALGSVVPEGETLPPVTAGTASVAPGATGEDEDEDRRGKFWREDKIGLLLTMASEPSAHDPCPEIPKTFLNPARMSKLVRELKKRAPPQEEAAKDTDDPDASDEALRHNEARWQPPEVETKQVVASRRCWADFGPMLATAAWALGFFVAARKAFVADGAENNWTLHRQLFSSFVPILDFIHALSYVFASALAGRRFAEGWQVYERWIQWVWSGRVEEVIAELVVRQAEVGSPVKDEPEGSPRAVVARALTYLQNHKERMRYAEYRRQGLPLTSSHVESAVKQINYRVKGTEKFWTEVGAEELLQLRADYLSDGDLMEAYWERRENTETGQNRYRRVA